jgi:hypothetical protein
MMKIAVLDNYQGVSIRMADRLALRDERRSPSSAIESRAGSRLHTEIRQAPTTT